MGGEIDHYGKVLSDDPAAFRREEAAHIHGTASRFVFYRISELVVAAGGVGAAVYGFAAHRDAWQGAGIGVAAEALTLFALDAYGQSRARNYEGQIERFDPTLALSLGAPGALWGAGVGGRF